jgi:hypothetical protein
VVVAEKKCCGCLLHGAFLKKGHANKALGEIKSCKGKKKTATQKKTAIFEGTTTRKLYPRFGLSEDD